MELHRKYEIPGMFFVPTENSEGRNVLTKEAIKSNASKLISFGGHTEHHTYLTSIPEEEVEKEIVNNKTYLEDILGASVDHFCLPGGKYDQTILNKVYQNFKTCRTADTMAFSSEGNLFIPTFHFYPRGIKSLVGNSLRHRNLRMGINVVTHANMPYFSLIRKLTDEAAKLGKSQILIWGHSWEIDELELWNELEQYMVYVKNAYKDHIVSFDELTIE